MTRTTTANPSTPTAEPPQGENPNATTQRQVQQPIVENVAMDVDEPKVEEFALTPALATKEPLEFSGMGSKVFKNGALPLTTAIDCEPNNLNSVLAAIEERAVLFGWLDTVLNIECNVGEYKDLLTQHGEISLPQVKSHVLTYINRNVRAAQDSMMLYSCITNTLTQEARKKLYLYKKEYYINNRTPSGALLLKVLIRESHIDTNATIKFIRENLSSLDTYMVKIDSDIEKFNAYVYTNLLNLKAHGKETSDLMANLFKGYSKASDKTFVNYIAKKEDDYDEGRDIGHAVLMHLALQKYKVLKEAGKWNAPTDAEVQIIALQAQVTQLKARAKIGSGTGNYNKPKGNNNKSKLSGNQKPSKWTDHGKSSGKKPPPEWMTTQPKEGEPENKTVNGKEYHWCKNHAAWTRHKPSECKGIGYIVPKDESNQNKRKVDKETKKGNGNKKPKMVALSAMYTNSDEE